MHNNYVVNIKTDFIFAMIISSVFCLPVSNLKTVRLKFSRLILPAVLYRCEIWSLIVKEEHRLCSRTEC
jgi:hypothetical protein